MIKREKMTGIFAVMLIALSFLSADDIKPNGCKGETLCTELPLNENCGFYFNVGLIYQQMRVSNTMSAYDKVVGPTLGGSASDPTNTYNMYNLAFDMEPGLRFGVGYEHGHDDWQVNASFEWLRSEGLLSKNVISPTELFATYNDQDDQDDGFLNVNSTLDIDYFLLDVYLSRGSFISKKYSIEPVAGFKASWLYYEPKTGFTIGGEINDDQTQLYVSKVDFWGVGPMVGINSNYHMCVGWSIFVLSDFSILLGESALNYYDGVVTVEVEPGLNKVTTTLGVLCPAMRGVVGLQYERYVMSESQHLALRAGFDARYYFNQYPVTFMSASSNPSIIENGSFGMVGLLLDLGWSF